MNESPLAVALRRATDLMAAAGAPGVFVGGVAVLVWGEFRLTKDVDVLVDLQSAGPSRLLAEAAALGLTWDAAEAALLVEGGFLRLDADSSDGIPIDVLVADTTFHRQVVARGVEVDFAGRTLRLATAEDVILLKLIAFRPQDTLDLDALFRQRASRLDVEYLREWGARLGVDGKLAMWLDAGGDGDQGPSKP